MFFLNFLAYIVLIGGPVVAYHVATSQPSPTRRLEILIWSGAGGAVAAILLLALTLLFDLSSYAALKTTALAFVRSYALSGLMLGIIGVVTRTESRRGLFVIGAAKLALMRVVGYIVGAEAPNSPFHDNWIVALVVESVMTVVVIKLIFQLPWLRAMAARLWRPVRSVARRCLALFATYWKRHTPFGRPQPRSNT